MSKIMISKKGTQFGPFTVEVARKMFLNGRFTATDRARMESSTEWVPLVEIPGIARAAPAPEQGHPPAGQFVRRFVMLGGLAAAALLVLVCEHLVRTGHVDGEVAIVTEDGRRYRLAKVTVSLFPLGEIQEHLRRRSLRAGREYSELTRKIEETNGERDQAKTLQRNARDQGRGRPPDAQTQSALEEATAAADAALFELKRKAIPYQAGTCFLEQLPKPIASAQSDWYGKFSISTPSKGDFAVVARRGHLTNPAEEYCWIVRVSLNGKSRTAIVLSDENLVSADSPDSLVRAFK